MKLKSGSKNKVGTVDFSLKIAACCCRLNQITTAMNCKT